MRSAFLVAFTVVSATAWSAAEFTAETANPKNNMFAIGKPADVVFSAKGWAADEERRVVAEVFDYRGERVTTLEAALKAGVGGSGAVRMALPTDRYGFFRVKAKAGDLRLPKCGTRPAGEFTYGVTIDPKDRPDIPQERAFMGIHGESCGQGRWMGAHQGFAQYFTSEEKREKWLRGLGKMPWPTWGFSPLRMKYWYAEQEAFSEPSRKWLAENGKKETIWTIRSTEEGRAVLDEYLDYWTDRNRRCQAYPGKRIYELLWEPDLSAPSKRDLVDLAAYLAKAVKARDPEGLIALPTLSNCSLLSWHRELFELGMLKYTDVFDLHPYTAYPPEPNGYLENIRAIKRMLTEYGRPDIPFICTESGYQTSATKEGERLQLDGQVRVQLILLGEGIWFNCPFYGTDFGGDRNDHQEGDYGLTYNLDYPNPRFGAKHISPRPAFLGLCAFSMLLDGWKAHESIDCLGETVLGYVYTNGTGRAIAALWDYGGNPSRVCLPTGKSSIEIADVMGNRSHLATRDGQLDLTLSTSPAYVLDLDLAAWDRGMEGFCAAAAEARLNKKRAPIKLEKVSAAFIDGHPAATVVVSNNSNCTMMLTVASRIRGEPDARQTVRASFAPCESKTVVLPMPQFDPRPFDVFKLEIEVFDETGNRDSRSAEVNFWPVEHVTGVGQKTIARWRGTKRFKVEPHEGGLAADDLSPEIGFSWNEEFLLVDALVKDDAYRQDKTGWWTWDGDSIQFGFAKKRLERLSANDYTDSLVQGVSEIDFALTAKGPEGYRTITFDPYRLPTDMFGKGQIDANECGMVIEKFDTNEGVTIRYRLAIPWSYLNKGSAVAGESVFVAALFNDRDPGDKILTSIPLFDLKRMPPRHFGALFLLK